MRIQGSFQVVEPFPVIVVLSFHNIIQSRYIRVLTKSVTLLIAHADGFSIYLIIRREVVACTRRNGEKQSKLLAPSPVLQDDLNKKAQLSLTNPRDACEKFARFT